MTERIYVFNEHPLFAYTDAWGQEGARGTVDFHGCRLLRDFPLPRNPPANCRHDERFCRRGNELNVISRNAYGHLMGYDDGNHLQLDLRKEDLEAAFPRPPPKET